MSFEGAETRNETANAPPPLARNKPNVPPHRRQDNT